MSRIYDALRHSTLNEPESWEGAARPAAGERSNIAPGDPTPVNSIAHVVNSPPRPETHIMAGLHNDSPIREHFRYLEHRLRGLRGTSRMKRVLVTSSIPGEGKTVIAANLAATLACGPERVILIDADMRGPSSERLFGMSGHAGLADILEGRAKASDVMVYLEALKIHYIPPGKAQTSPADLVQGAAARNLLETLEEFDWIILDSTPVCVFADALSLAEKVDGVVFVTRSGVTGRRELEQGLAALKESPLVAVVLNAYDQPRKRYYYSYYHSGRRAES